MPGVVDLQPAMHAEIHHLAAEIRDRLTIYLLGNLVAGSNFCGSREATYLGSCAMRLVAWTLGHRAVASGEISEEHRRQQFAIGADRPPGSEEAITSVDAAHPFSDLIERSQALLQRCERLDRRGTREI